MLFQLHCNFEEDSRSGEGGQEHQDTKWVGIGGNQWGAYKITKHDSRAWLFCLWLVICNFRLDKDWVELIEIHYIIATLSSELSVIPLLVSCVISNTHVW